MHTCIICGNSNAKNSGKIKSYFSFPKNPTKRIRWLRSLNLTNCTDWHRVCSDHFSPNQIRKEGPRPRLSTCAVPILSLAQTLVRELTPEAEHITQQNIPENNEIKLEPENEEHNHAMYTCCVPECIYSAAYLNGNINDEFLSFSLFIPSSIENMIEWGSALGISLAMDSKVCEKHFKPHDLYNEYIIITDKDKVKVKALDKNAVPIKIED